MNFRSVLLFLMNYIQFIRRGSPMSLRKISADELHHILQLHAQWVKSGFEEGKKTNLSNIDFSDADLRGVDLRGANLRGNKFFNANLQDVNFYWANLYTADFRGSDLRGANLEVADVRFADLRGADLRGANLCRTSFEGSDFRNSTCDKEIQRAESLVKTAWNRSDVPWWMGHEDQAEIIIHNF